MARRRKSYFAAANKGKAADVFMNNLMAGASSSAKKRAKEKAQKERALERARKAEKKQKEQEERRLLKAREKAEREEKKLNEKLTKYYKRLELEFEKQGMTLIDSIAIEIITKAIDSSVTVNQLRKYFIEGEEDNLKLKTAESILQDLISKNLKVSSAEDYINQAEYESLCNHVKGIDWSSIMKLAEDGEVSKYLKTITEREDHLERRISANKEISEFTSKLIKDLVLLPEDFAIIDQMIEADEGMSLTVESIKETKEYLDGVKNKEVLVEKVNIQYSELINTPTEAS
tara:strand:+ start:653 stop:1516 length:864 start_codon:yes stop_codon:yes gene_type:complete